MTWKELQEKIRQSVGEASTCWENPDSAGVFDSDKADRIASDTCEYVADFIVGLMDAITKELRGNF